MEKRRGKVSIISINYNNAAVTCEMLASLERVIYQDFEVIIVDNGSEENPDVIEQNFPWIKLIKTGKNLGFAGGNNAGFHAATGDYFLLLNNDTEVESGFLEPLVEKMETDPRVGIVSSKLLYYYSDRIVQYAGSTSINPFTGRSRFIGQQEQDQEQFCHSCPTHFGHGAAMMVSRDVIKKVGLMADLFFLYYEELDFCERIRRAGYTIWFIGSSVVYHKESMSVGKQSPLKVYYMSRNRLLFVRRNIRGIKLAINLLFFSIVSLPKNLLTYLIKNRPDLAKSFLAGYFWNWTHFNIHQNSKLI